MHLAAYNSSYTLFLIVILKPAGPLIFWKISPNIVWSSSSTIRSLSICIIKLDINTLVQTIVYSFSFSTCVSEPPHVQLSQWPSSCLVFVMAFSKAATATGSVLLKPATTSDHIQHQSEYYKPEKTFAVSAAQVKDPCPFLFLLVIFSLHEVTTSSFMVSFPREIRISCHGWKISGIHTWHST